MAKLVSTIARGMIAGTGILKKLAEAIEDLGGSDDDLRRIETDDELRRKIAEIIIEAGRVVKSIIIATFKMSVGSGETTDELVAVGEYNWVNSRVTQKNFPNRAKERREREIVILHFDRDITSEEAIAEAKAHGLARPDYEDALYFGIQHPKEQRKYPIVFLHAPWRRGPDGDLVVVVLSKDAGDRNLNLNRFECTWNQYCRFAFVRK